MFTRLTVLCVDTDAEFRRSTATLLKGAGDSVECLTADSVEAALEIVEETTVECLVSGYELRDETGLSLLRSVRDRDELLPFLLVPEDGSERIASEAISAGVTDYLVTDDGRADDGLLERIESAVDQYRSATTMRDTRSRLERLHESAADIAGASDVETAIELSLDAANQILDFDVCGIYRVDDETFVPVTEESYVPAGPLPTVDEGILGETYRTGDSFHIADTDSNPHAAPDRPSFTSVISVPVGEYGVFQAISTRPGAFSSSDLELAELLVTHTTQAVHRLESERDLRRTNERLEAILHNTTANVYVKDLDGRYELVNDRFCEELERDRSEILGRTDSELQPGSHAARVQENDQLAIERNEAIEVEETAEFGGEERVYYSVKVPLTDEQGDPTGVCGISTDITDIKEREAALEHQKEHLDEFAKLVSHDLKSPLSVAQGYLSLIAEDTDHENIVDVQRAHDRMQSIIEGLLTLARQGQEIGERESVRIGVLARNAWSIVETADATLETPTDAVVEADPGRLQQAFENLFRNAVEHGGPAVTVRVGSIAVTRPEAPERATMSDGGIDDRHAGEPREADEPRETDEVAGFYVEDSGAGFGDTTDTDPFELGVTSNCDGTGFGLAIVSKIVEAHDWDISLAEGELGGARFEVRF
ncbi:PAS domain-containing protein [Haloarchaeobius sp. DFWS5]|uniref:PAS domain-containing protein n=1 Tax=Haloarchaeobius sp. DFWS5 TaxID=3446114 RepID=UPI003EBC2032